MGDLYVCTWGTGEPVLLVHGSGSYGERVWSNQRELADHYRVMIPDRRGYGASPPCDRSDFEVDAEDIAGLLEDGAHLVGFSHGGLIALLAAARRAEAVRSLTVIEPPAVAIARGHPLVEGLIERMRTVYASAPHISPDEFHSAFNRAFGVAGEPAPLTPELRAGVQTMMVERPAWEADIPVERLAVAAFPKLVVSGGWSAVLELMCDALAEQVVAARVAIRGRGHYVQHTGKPFNERLEALFRSASRA
ncbi:MAG: alpha/beta hydrolase [Armatimonadetes bacterium]|nr:alpha/beta hydrolase [Armatimonadota bacterium]